jgi:deoxycytidine triphosphate deaminase
MKYLNHVATTYNQPRTDDCRVSLTPNRIFRILEKPFIFGDNKNENRALQEIKELSDGYGQSLGWYYLTPGLYEIIFDGFISIADNEIVNVITDSELIRNGITITSGNYVPKYTGNIKATMNISGGPFKFKNDAVLAHLVFDVMQGMTVTYKENVTSGPGLLTAAMGSSLFYKNPAPNAAAGPTPFIQSIINAENTVADKPAIIPVVKRTNTIKGTVWVYKEDENGVIIHKTRVKPGEVEDYKAKNYIHGFPPRKNKGE